MTLGKAPWERSLVQRPAGVAGRLLTWEGNDADGPWRGLGEPGAEALRPTCPCLADDRARQ
jgi:hypothetical protein